MSKNVAFYLLGSKGLIVLKDFLQKFTSININCVVIGEDQSVENDYSKDIIELCIENRISFYKRKDVIIFNSNLIFVVGWRWIINQNQEKLIVLHDSLLPRYRGFNPLVTALLNNDREIGVTALFAAKEYDRGEIIKQKSIIIDYPIKLIEVINKISEIYSEIINEIFYDFLQNNKIKSIKQDESKASYSLWRDEYDYKIDWRKSAAYISRFIDSVGYPYSGAQTTFEDKTCIIIDSEAIEDVLIENRTVGKIIFIENGFPIIVCGQGLLKIKQMKNKETNENMLPMSKFRARFN